jgi:hypothetical protein
MKQTPAPGLAGFWRQISRNRSGLALIEFGLTLPLVLVTGGYGAEMAWLAITNMRVSQYALNLADTASRVGVDAGAGVSRLREADVNDVFQGIRLESGTADLGSNGRVILSSLENTKQSYDAVFTQRIHWQRCFGLKSGTDYNSHYGTTTTTAGTDGTQANAGTTVATGMGETGSKVNAPQNTGVMYVEINYLYQPLFGSMFVTPPVIRYTASLIVRDNRDFTQIYNPTDASATRSTCDQYAS